MMGDGVHDAPFTRGLGLTILVGELLVGGLALVVFLRYLETQGLAAARVRPFGPSLLGSSS